MKTFEEWWSDFGCQQKSPRGNPRVLSSLRLAAGTAWSASRRELYPYEEAQCFCGDIYSPDMNLNACIVIQETGYCPNCIAMGMREYKK